jgi:hypothetical protein
MRKMTLQLLGVFEIEIISIVKNWSNKTAVPHTPPTRQGRLHLATAAPPLPPSCVTVNNAVPLSSSNCATAMQCRCHHVAQHPCRVANNAVPPPCAGREGVHLDRHDSSSDRHMRVWVGAGRIRTGQYEKFQTGPLLGSDFSQIRVTHGSHTVQDKTSHCHVFSWDRLTRLNIFNTLLEPKPF